MFDVKLKYFYYEHSFQGVILYGVIKFQMQVGKLKMLKKKGGGDGKTERKTMNSRDSPVNIAT